MIYNKILLVEPQCAGFEHAPFNAAILQSVMLAFPSVEILFLAEGEHIVCVRKYLQERSILCDQIQWNKITIPKGSLTNWFRLPGDYKCCKTVFKIARENGVDSILFLSITNTGLLALKTEMKEQKLPFNVFVVFHAVLNSIEKTHKLELWNRMLGLKSVLKLSHPAKLRYIVHGTPIYKQLMVNNAILKDQFETIDIPTFWFNKGDSNLSDKKNEKIRFGFLGSDMIGFERFETLANEFIVSKKVNNAEFQFVGHLYPVRHKIIRRIFPSKNSVRYFQHFKKGSSDVVLGLSYKPLTSEEYCSRVNNVTYVIWAGDPERCKLAGTGTFIDTLSFVKPGIFLRNKYIEYYFSKMGDIGYLCDSVEEIKKVVQEILAEFPSERYHKKCENIISKRNIFEPENVASQIRDIFDGGLLQ